MSNPTTDAAPPAFGTSSAERSLALLALLADAGRPLALADLAAGLGLPKATAHRQCMQLLQSGHLARDVDERVFAVGPALRKLALDTLNHETLRGVRRDVLTELVSRINETCNFTTLDGTSVLYLDRVEAPWPWRLKLEAGEHVPLHCTASGKLLLALMPQPKREALLARLTLQRMTPRTITSAKALRAACTVIAAAGHSLDEGEFIDGLLAIAVPVFDAAGEIRATLATHAPASRMTRDAALAHLPVLHAAAGRMRELL